VSAIEKFAYLLNAINQYSAERHAAFKHPLFDDPSNIAPINIGTVHGGEWHSTVPEEVVAEGRLGVFPGESNESARQRFETAIQTVAASDAWLSQNPPRVEWFEGQFESGETPLDHPLMRKLSEAHQQVTGHGAKLRGVTYGSDMRLFTNHAKIAATHYGPGDVGMAHAANEFVPLVEVVTATKVVANFIAEWCGGGIK